MQPSIATVLLPAAESTATEFAHFGNPIIANSTAGTNFVPSNSLLASIGHNLSSDASAAAVFDASLGDMNNTDPRLGTLASNGGPTQTYALLAKSPAIDAGNDDGPSVDQRGMARIKGKHSDIGAYEK